MEIPGYSAANEPADEVDAKPPSFSRVVMYETIMSQHVAEGGLLDVAHLLSWADLATCTAAEAHAGTNCVTAAVSDLCFERGVEAPKNKNKI